MSDPAKGLVALNMRLPNGNTDLFYFDASVQEQHIVTAQVMDHQVETGSNPTDFIRPMPRELSVQFVVTNTPIVEPLDHAFGATASEVAQSITVGGQTIGWKALQFSSDFDRVAAVYGGLLEAAQLGALFTVTTSLATYAAPDGSPCMAIVNFAIPRSVENSNNLAGTVDFQELRFVDTETTTVKTKPKPANRGTKAGKEIDPEVEPQKTSLLNRAIGG